MAEVLSIPVAVIGLMQGIEIARKSLVLISELSGAPADTKRIGHELQLVQAVIQALDNHIRKSPSITLGNESTKILQSQLSCFKTDLDEFGRLLHPHLDGNTSWARLKIRIRWVVGLDKKLGYISNRLTAHSVRLQLALSLYTSDEARQSSMQIRHQMSAMAHSQDRYYSDVNEIAKQITTRRPQTPNFPNAHLPRQITFVQGCAKAGAGLLSDIAPTLYKLFSDKGLPGMSSQSAEWVMSRVWGLLLDILSGKIDKPSNAVLVTQSTLPEDSFVANQLQAIRLKPPTGPRRDIVRMSFVPLRRHTCLASMNSFEIGENQKQIHLTLFDHRSSSPLDQVESSFLQCRLYASTSDQSRAIGVVVKLCEAPETQGQLPRSLATFGVHMSDSPIIRHIRNNDIQPIRRLLSLGVILPNDRDEEGNTLLFHSLSECSSYEMCELLLLQHADPSDCNRNGDHALAILLANLTQSYEDVSTVIKVIDLLLRYSRPGEAHSTLRYKRRHGYTLAPAGLLHAVTAIGRHFSATVAHIPYLFWQSILNDVDLELTDINGNTALLHSLFYLPLPILLEVASSLIRAGADTAAKNIFGEGCLHLLLRRLTSCSIPDITVDIKNGIIDLLVKLIQGGCDLVSGNTVGYTPIDAAMSPMAWPYLCTAIKNVSQDLKHPLGRLDFAARIDTPSNAELEEKVKQIIHHRAVSKERKVATLRLGNLCSNDQGTACYLCGQRPDPSLRDPPFDEFFSDIVDELGHGIHMTMYNHPIAGECLHVHREDPTYNLDYHPMQMTLDRLYERSWRRHVALILWERGLLDDW